MKGLCSRIHLREEARSILRQLLQQQKTLVSLLQKNPVEYYLNITFDMFWLAQNFGSMMAELFHVKTRQQKQENKI